MMRKISCLLAVLASAFQLYGAGFRASLDGTLEGRNAAGAIIPGVTGKPCSWLPGVNGQGLLLDSTDLKYPAPGNLDLARGAVSFWIKPENWGDKAVNFLPVFAVDSGKGSGFKILLYYHRDNSGAVWDLRVLTPAHKEIISQIPIRDDLKLNEWNHLTISWTNQEIEFSCNGSQPRRQTYGLPIKLQGHRRDQIVFMPDDFWRTKSTWRTGLDEVEVFASPLTAADTQALYLRYRGNRTRTASGVVPQLTSPVTLDGKLDPGEWDDASRFPVQTIANSKKFFAGPAAWAYAKRDRENLYVAFEIEAAYPLPAAGAPKYDDKIFLGEEAEFVIAVGADNFRQYFIAPDNHWACLDYRNRWQPEADFGHAAAVMPGKGWTAELRIPLQDLPAASPWSANFGIHRRQAPDIADKLDRWIAWSVDPAGKSLEFRKNFGKLVLTERAERIESIGAPGRGDYRFRAVPSGTLTVDNLLQKTSFTLKSGENRRVEEPGLYILTLKTPGGEWSAMAEKQELFSFDFVCDADRKIMEFHTLIPETPALTDKVKDGGISVTASIVNRNGKTVAAKTAVLTQLRDLIPVPFPELESERYILRAEVTGAGAEKIVKELPFTVPDRTFIGNKLGISEEIPAPWQEVVQRGETVETAFQKYDFAGGIFPVRAWNRGRQVLTGSTGLVAERLGSKLKLVQGRISVTKTKTSLIRSGVLTDPAGAFEITWRGETAFDGLTSYRFRLCPKSGHTAELSRLQALFEVPAAAALVATTPDFAVDWLKNGFVSAPLFAGVTGSSGFAIFTGDDTNYVRQEGEHPFSVKRGADGKAVLKVDFMRYPAKFAVPVEFSFALMATPGKPPRADWRRLHSEGWLAYPGQNWAVRGWTCEKYQLGYMRGYLLTTPADPAAAKAAVADHAARGVSDVTYTCCNLIPGNNPLHDYFAKSWARPVHGEVTRISQTREKDGTPYFFGVPVCTNCPGYRDYLCWYIAKNMDDTGFKGVYFDFGSEAPTDTSFNGQVIPDVLSCNRQKERVNLYGVRELFLRLRRIIKSRHADGVLYAHSWRSFHPAVISFVDVVNPGEEFMHSFPRDRMVYVRDREFSPPELWRTVYSSEALGAAVQFLPMLYWLPEIRDIQQMGFAASFAGRLESCKALLNMALLHDVQISGGGYAAIDGLWPKWDALAPEKAQFHGYWEQREYTAGGAKVSYYSWPDSNVKLFVLGNFGDTELEVELTGDSGAVAGLTEFWPVSAALPAGKIKIAPFGFRLLLQK